MTGLKIGRLSVLKLSHISKSGKAHWTCKCDCGNIKNISGDKLRDGRTKSCGCLQMEMRANGLHKTHGLTNTRLYTEWLNMRRRCNDEKNKHYGARGISVCKEWSEFNIFAQWAVFNGYNDKLTIERIDVNGNYEPRNCKWIAPVEQHLNRTDSHRITAFGITKTIKEWSNSSGIKYDTIERRINAYGWRAEDAVTVPPYRKRVVLSGY